MPEKKSKKRGAKRDRSSSAGQRRKRASRDPAKPKRVKGPAPLRTMPG